MRFRQAKWDLLPVITAIYQFRHAATLLLQRRSTHPHCSTMFGAEPENNKLISLLLGDTKQLSLMTQTVGGTEHQSTQIPPIVVVPPATWHSVPKVVYL